MGISGRRHAYTIGELLVTLAVVAVLSSIVFGPFQRASARNADGHRLRATHQTLLVWAQENQDRYPVPGLVWRHDPVPRTRPGWIPCCGSEDTSRNTTAGLYSLLVARNYLNPEELISPRERNRNVTQMRDYDYSAYDPVGNVYWDVRMQANLEEGSHASYAHVVLAGARKRMQWRNTANPNTPILSNRGPRGGIGDPTSLTCRWDGTWRGFVVFADNSVQWLETMTPENVRYEPWVDPPVDLQPDNIFAAEFHDKWTDAPMGANDALLSFTLEAGQNAAVIQHD